MIDFEANLLSPIIINKQCIVAILFNLVFGWRDMKNDSKQERFEQIHVSCSKIQLIVKHFFIAVASPGSVASSQTSSLHAAPRPGFILFSFSCFVCLFVETYFLFQMKIWRAQRKFRIGPSDKRSTDITSIEQLLPYCGIIGV